MFEMVQGSLPSLSRTKIPSQFNPITVFSSSPPPFDDLITFPYPATPLTSAHLLLLSQRSYILLQLPLGLGSIPSPSALPVSCEFPVDLPSVLQTSRTSSSTVLIPSLPPSTSHALQPPMSYLLTARAGGALSLRRAFDSADFEEGVKNHVSWSHKAYRVEGQWLMTSGTQLPQLWRKACFVGSPDGRQWSIALVELAEIGERENPTQTHSEELFLEHAELHRNFEHMEELDMFQRIISPQTRTRHRRIAFNHESDTSS